MLPRVAQKYFQVIDKFGWCFHFRCEKEKKKRRGNFLGQTFCWFFNVELKSSYALATQLLNLIAMIDYYSI